MWGWSIIEKEYNSSLKQIGSLGGGNHFIEIQQGSNRFVWLMIYSGSLNNGFKVAYYYNKLAVELKDKRITAVPLKWPIAFLSLDSEEGQSYMKEMQHCVDFAFPSRKLMMESVKDCLADVVGEVEFDEMINVSHNHAIMEHHFGKNVMVHR